jgi:hypothetical protein
MIKSKTSIIYYLIIAFFVIIIIPLYYWGDLFQDWSFESKKSIINLIVLFICIGIPILLFVYRKEIVILNNYLIIKVPFLKKEEKLSLKELYSWKTNDVINNNRANVLPIINPSRVAIIATSRIIWILERALKQKS